MTLFNLLDYVTSFLSFYCQIGYQIWKSTRKRSPYFFWDSWLQRRAQNQTPTPLSIRSLTPTLNDAMYLYLVDGFQWNLQQSNTMTGHTVTFDVARPARTVHRPKKDTLTLTLCQNPNSGGLWLQLHTLKFNSLWATTITHFQVSMT